MQLAPSARERRVQLPRGENTSIPAVKNALSQLTAASGEYKCLGTREPDAAAKGKGADPSEGETDRGRGALRAARREPGGGEDGAGERQGAQGGGGAGGAQGAAAHALPREPRRQHGGQGEPAGRAGDEEVPAPHDQGGPAPARQLPQHPEHPGGPPALARRAAQPHPRQGNNNAAYLYLLNSRPGPAASWKQKGATDKLNRCRAVERAV